jgi:hypothetical protein
MERFGQIRCTIVARKNLGSTIMLYNEEADDAERR